MRIPQHGQRFLHLGRILEPVCRAKGTGLQHDSLQFLAAVDRSRDRLTAEPALPGFLIHGRRGNLGRQGQERCPPLVHGPVQYQTQGIQVRRSAVGLTLVNLRSHVLKSTDFGAADRLVGDFCNTEITQLIIAGFGHENILGFDIPVNDIFVFAQDQSIAQVHAQLDDLLLIINLAHAVHQWGQQLHLDEHIPADTILMLDVPDIVAVDHIGMALDIQHQRVLPGNIFQITPEMGGQAGIVITLAAQFLNFFIVLGDGNDLQCCGFNFAEHFPLDLIHRTETALANDPDHIPTGPGCLNTIHGSSSFLSILLACQSFKEFYIIAVKVATICKTFIIYYC